MSAGLPAPVLAAGLAAAGVLLAGPVSVAYAGAGWSQRSPRAALVLWQAVCLGAGLSMLGSLVTLAVAPLGDNLFSALITFAEQLWDGRPFDGLTPWRVACGLLAIVIAMALSVVLIRCLYLAMSRRRTHRSLIDLLSRPQAADANPALLSDVRVLDHASAVAYSVPGWHSRVVLSAGLLDLLTAAELAAVLEHERAHLRSRHDLLILPFQAWAASLGPVPGVQMARQAVAGLAEMLADDLALRRARPAVLASALAKVTLATRPSRGGSADPGADLSGASATGSGAVAVATMTGRVRRLLDPDPLPQASTLGLYLLAALLVIVPDTLLLIGWR